LTNGGAQAATKAATQAAIQVAIQAATQARFLRIAQARFLQIDMRRRLGRVPLALLPGWRVDDPGFVLGRGVRSVA
jgi:hypothetical protein